MVVSVRAARDAEGSSARDGKMLVSVYEVPCPIVSCAG
jgi:hypothetical protein